MLEHPDVTSALRTGYPLRTAILCQRCGGIAEYADDMGYNYCAGCAVSLAEREREEYISDLENMGWHKLIDWAGFVEVY